MSRGKAKTEDFTHVRVLRRNREKAKEVARRKAAKENREIHYSNLIDEVLERGLELEDQKLL